MKIQGSTLNTKNFTIKFFAEKNGVIQGSYEHDRYGEDVGGGLWVEKHELIDYDGMYKLPEEVIEALVCQFKISCAEVQS